jgi:hypothetical protein
MKLAFESILAALVLRGAGSRAGAAAGTAHVAKKKSTCTKGACARRRARKLLADRVFIRFTETGTDSSLDQRLHLCRDESFIYDSVSHISGIGPELEDVQRTTGSWSVSRASMNKKGNRGSATVRGDIDDGGTTSVKITWNPSNAQIDGNDVIVDSSDLC